MYLENLRQELAELEISIARQRALLEELKERKSTVRAELDAFIFPVLTLPNEITTEIFLQYTFDKDHNEDRFPCLAVHLLLSVCWAWRTLALSVPALWATLDLGALPRYRKAPGELEGFVDTWFSRAGTLPLSLHCIVKRSGQLDKLNTIIHRYAPRLESLHLCIFKGFVSHLTHRMTFPLLQDLDLSNYDFSTPSTPIATPVLMFREAPRLRRVTLKRISPASLILPWGLLETFSVGSIPPQECLGVLRAAPLLRNFEFYGRSTNNSFNNDEPIIFHPRLTSFVLHIGGQKIMQYLALAALNDLCLGAFPGLDDDIFVPFLTRTRGSLRKFTVSSLPVFSLSMPWFQHMMHLTDLNLSRLKTASDFVRALNRQREREFLPTLENLTLTDWKPDQVEAQLLDALHSRCTRTEAEDGLVQMPLKSFRLIWADDFPAPTSDIASLIYDHHVALRDLQRRGIEIKVGTKDHNFL